MLESYNKRFCALTNSHCLNFKHIDMKDAILQLEEIQHNACGRIFLLIDENKNLEGEIVTARLEIMSMKQKFKTDMHDMVTRLDVSNALGDKLQTRLESIGNKCQFSFEIEEKFTQQNNSLLADLGLLEVRIQELTGQNGYFAQETACLDALGEELASNKSAIFALMQEKQELVVALKYEDEKSIKISSEITCLKESLSKLHDELQREKVYSDELEGKIKDLTSQLNKDHAKLIYLEQQNTELVHTRGLALDLELEKSRLANLLEQQMVLTKELHVQISDQSSLECQLLLLYDHSLAADVELTCVSNQYRSLCEKYRQHLMLSESSLREDRERYHELEVTLNQYGTSEAHLSEERENLTKILKSLESEFEVAEAQNRLLSDSNNDLKNQLVEYKNELRVAREKKEAEGHSVAVQDSLRVAFMKEQYETQLQEPRQKLSISKKHGEEMLLKFQDSIDEVENRKKSEAVNLKRTEQLSNKIIDIEKELQLVLEDKREMSRGHDRVRA
ncbi:centromere-associated protein E [Dorcoceras hygrometricum]|uniref:Centromere-associated protein E n=1 Tax=Dorcoceras hygrometricum TaxID=472368 RepID=A0A2Z7ASU8_9LAMI|nr:centromere-associated protein E [Dorcoceras hygrometricum]